MTNRIRTLLVGAGITGAVGVAQVLVDLDITAITDWKGWVLGLVAAFIRPVAKYVVANLPRLMGGGSGE